MIKYAIIKTGGKQIKVAVGQAIYVEKLDVKIGEKVAFDEVVLVGGDSTIVGTSLIKKAAVIGTVEKHGKQKKVVVFRYKPKKHSHRKQGHRQPYTKVIIDEINTESLPA
ncbi:MAG: 50S ribosomal protein L21 [Lactobacillales bacterium]|jgi:large subunit ribosomal protein L21|nr:50S ribosomal protein L21 [Lactobacillales bacterium]